MILKDELPKLSVLDGSIGAADAGKRFTLLMLLAQIGQECMKIDRKITDEEWAAIPENTRGVLLVSFAAFTTQLIDR